MNRENIVGLNTPPWRTPTGQSKKSEYSPFVLTQVNKESYILQDTHFDPKMENCIRAEWGYKSYFASCNSNSRGVAILFNNNLEKN